MRWISDKTVLSLTTMLCLAIAVVLWQQQRLHERLVHSATEEEAERLANALDTFRTLYTSEVVAPLSEQGIKATHDYDSDANRGHTIPLPATLSMKMGNELGIKMAGGNTQLYSAFPFPYPDRKGLKDQFAKDAWEALRAEPDKPFQRYEQNNGVPLLRYAIADRMRISCVNCHNNHPDSPKRDWKKGDVRGVLEVSLPLKSSAQVVSANLRESFLLLSAVGATGLFMLIVVLRRLKRISAELEKRVKERTKELEHTAERLQKQEEQAKSLFTDSPSALLIVNRNGEVILLNDQAENLFGYQQQELTGKVVECLMPERYRESHAQMREDYFLNPESRPMGARRDLLGLNKEGIEIPLEIGLTPVETDEGLAVLAAIVDLSERKRFEQALQQHAEELQVAKEAAEVASRAKSDFLANMSHEIRTPMNAIIGMNELVLDTDLSPEQRDYLKIAGESAESLLTIIDSILDFSKIEAGKLELDSVSFDLRETIGDTLKTLGQRAHSKDLELAWSVEQNVPRFLEGDPGRLRQMLVNLVGNAINFTESGEVLVSVQSTSAPDAAVILQIKVKDTGIGIPEEKRKTIFSPFEQVDSSTTRQYGGTGLGLSITARIAQAMGGDIRVESPPGQGSTFHITVKMKEGVPTHPNNLDSLDLKDFPVLVIDDNETNRHILNKLLSSWGMEVEEVAGGPQALEFLENILTKSQTLPLLICDVHMPGMDGFELLQKLRNHPTLKESVAIMLTSGGHANDTIRCKELDVSAHILKPVKQSELLEAVMVAAGKWSEARKVYHPEKEIPAQPQESLNILLAEDSKPNQILAIGLLTKWGHEVETAENGQEAVTRYQQGNYDLVLMDVQMPIMDGLMATRQIRELEQDTGTNIPIIAMTARAMNQDRQLCMEAGMDDYLSKPIRATELASALRNLSTMNKQNDTIQKTEESEANHFPLELNGFINWDAALNAVNGDRELLQSVIDSVLDELPQLMQQLQSALSQQDHDTAGRAAHTISGTMRVFEAEQVITISRELEEKEHSGDFTHTAELYSRLQSTLDKALGELRAHDITEPGSAP